MQLPHNSSKESSEKNGSHSIISGNEFPPSTAPAAASNEEPDFSPFMWMANEDLEAFDRKVIIELHEHFGFDSGAALGDEEEEFLQRMLEEEEERDTVYFAPTSTMRQNETMQDLNNRMRRMGVSDEIAAQSNLNPHAAEFVPGQSFQNPDVVEPSALLAHQHNITQPVAGSMYPHNSMANPLHVGGMNNIAASISPNLHPQNIVLSHTSHPQLSPQQRFSNPVRAHMNGHSAIRRYFPSVNVPLYMSNVPVFPVMNGTPPYGQPHHHNRYQHHEGDRGNEDEGYGDN